MKALAIPCWLRQAWTVCSTGPKWSSSEGQAIVPRAGLAYSRRCLPITNNLNNLPTLHATPSQKWYIVAEDHWRSVGEYGWSIYVWILTAPPFTTRAIRFPSAS
jgi:hypothetical protein